MGLTPFLGISGQSSTPFSSVFPPVPVLSLPRLPSQDAFLRSRSALKGTRPLVLLALFTAQEAALVCTLLRTQGADYDSALGFLKSLWNSSPMGAWDPIVGTEREDGRRRGAPSSHQPSAQTGPPWAAERKTLFHLHDRPPAV